MDSECAKRRRWRSNLDAKGCDQGPIQGQQPPPQHPSRVDSVAREVLVGSRCLRVSNGVDCARTPARDCQCTFEIARAKSRCGRCRRRRLRRRVLYSYIRGGPPPAKASSPPGSHRRGSTGPHGPCDRHSTRTGDASPARARRSPGGPGSQAHSMRILAKLANLITAAIQGWLARRRRRPAQCCCRRRRHTPPAGWRPRAAGRRRVSLRRQRQARRQR